MRACRSICHVDQSGRAERGTCTSRRSCGMVGGGDRIDARAHIVIHEIGHHFGFGDDDMHALEDAAE